MALRVGTEPEPVAAIGEQQLALLHADSTDTAASRPSSTVVKRSCDAESWSRMRLASVMLVIDVIQPVCWPRESTSGDTYMRASNSAAVLAASP